MKNLVKGLMLAVAFLFALTFSVNAQSSDTKQVKADKIVMAKATKSAKTTMATDLVEKCECPEGACTCETDVKGDKKSAAKAKTKIKSEKAKAECTSKEEECSKCGEGKKV